MEIPESYRGSWEGMVKDDGRVNDYPCRVELHVNGGHTRYCQVRGRAKGSLRVTQVTVSHVELREDYVGPIDGPKTWTLTIRLSADGDLLCDWSGHARATLRIRQ